MQRGALAILVLLVGIVVGVSLWLSRGGPTGDVAPERMKTGTGETEPAPPPDIAGPIELEPPAPAAGVVLGVVLDREEHPLAGVHVELASAGSETREDRPFSPGSTVRAADLMDRARRSRNAGRVVAKTGEDGRFRLTPEGSSPYRLTAAKRGYGTKLLADVRPGGDEIVIVLLPGGTIRGTVASREDGGPLEGATVTAGPSSARSSPDGSFTVEDVDAGTAVVRASMPTYLPESREVAVEAGGTVEGVSFVLAPGSGILGVVLGTGDEPVPGALVRAHAGFGTSRSFQADSRGRFALGNLDAGTYTLHAKWGDYAPAVLRDVRLEAGQRLTGIVLRLRPGGAVTGEVRSASGAPIAGARLSVEALDDDGAPLEDAFARAFGAGARSDDRGRFRVGGLAAGSYKLKAFADRHLPATSHEFQVVEGASTRVDLTLETGVVVVGRVVDRSGMPVAGAKVEEALDVMRMAMTGFRQDRPSATSEEDGTFVLGGLTGAAIDLTASADGFASSTLKAVRPGEGEVEFVLGTLGSIVGRVLTDKPRVPVETFRVQAMPETSSLLPGMGGFQPAGSVENLGDGRFRVRGLEPGGYNLSVYTEDHAPGRRTGLTVEEGRETSVEILLVPGETLTGVVLSDADGRPIAGASVTADISGNSMLAFVGIGEKRATTTDADGRFSLVGLPAGTTAIRASHPDFAEKQVPGFRVPADEGLEIRLTGGGTVVVRVLTTDGAPRVSSMVILQRNMPYSQILGTTDEKGEAIFEKVAAGSYLAMEMNMEGLARRGLSGMDMKMKAVTVTDGQTVEVELQSEGGSTVRGRVLRGDKGVAGAMVFVLPGGQAFDVIEGMKFGVTDDRGAFEIADVKPGEYSLSVSRKMGSPPSYSEKITVEEGRDTVKDLALPLAGAGGRVVDESGKGVAGAQVAAVPVDLADFRTGEVDDAMRAYGQMESSGSDGGFRLDGLEPGDYVIRVWKEGAAAAYSEPFRVPDLGEGPANISVTLPSGLDVHVKVRKPDGSPLENAWVFVTDAQGRTVPQTLQIATQTDNKGAAVLRLSPGDYRVEAQAVGHPAAFREFHVGAGGAPTVVVDVPVGGSLVLLVQAADGSPVEDALVELLDDRGRSVGRRATQDLTLDAGDLTRTDEEGKLPFPILAPGTYRVRATTEDGRSAEGTAVVSPGGSHTLTLTLR